MREILFKAKRIDNGAWVEGFFVNCIGEYDEKPTADIVEIEADRIYVGEYSCFHSHEVDINTLCQYTGLTTKNGNMIFENDVVNYKNESVGYDKNGIVKFGEYHSGFDGNANHIGFFIEWNSDCLRKDIGFWAKNRELEVVGNIFDNPELIGGDA